MAAEADREDLYRRIRDELYHAKVLVRSSRNHTKNTAAALQDSEERLDGLLDELDNLPTPEGGPGNGEDSTHERPDGNGAHWQGRLEATL